VAVLERTWIDELMPIAVRLLRRSLPWICLATDIRRALGTTALAVWQSFRRPAGVRFGRFLTGKTGVLKKGKKRIHGARRVLHRFASLQLH
jgi:hypothetical protein